MAKKQVLQFSYKEASFKEYGAQPRSATLNRDQLVNRINELKPAQFDVDFDGSVEAGIFLAQLAETLGYLLDIEDQLAVFNRD